LKNYFPVQTEILRELFIKMVEISIEHQGIILELLIAGQDKRKLNDK
jgi:hypothetical protein